MKATPSPTNRDDQIKEGRGKRFKPVISKGMRWSDYREAKVWQLP